MPEPEPGTGSTYLDLLVEDLLLLLVQDVLLLGVLQKLLVLLSSILLLKLLTFLREHREVSAPAAGPYQNPSQTPGRGLGLNQRSGPFGANTRSFLKAVP